MLSSMVDRRSLSVPLRGLLLLAMLAGLGGCGFFTAVTNPKAATALGESANMVVVVRRADMAERTSEQVDRLLAETAVRNDSAWLEDVQVTAAQGKAALETVSKTEYYENQPVRVLPVEAWAQLLAKVAPSETDEGGADSDEDADDGEDEDGDDAAKDDDDVEVVEANGDDGDEGDEEDADEEDADEEEDEGWSAPSLIAALSEELAEEHAIVRAKNKAFADLKGKIEEREAKLDEEEDALSDAQVEKREAEIAKLEEQAEQAEEEYETAKEAFVAKLRQGAAKVPSELRTQLGPVFVALRQAVEDAEEANACALIRYPLAMPGLLTDVQQAIKINLADIIEEQSGTRPTMKGIQPGVSMKDGELDITINGLGEKELGELSLGEVTEQTITRSTAWFGRATATPGLASITQEGLSYQADVLDAILEGFVEAGWQRPEPVVIEAKEAPVVQQPSQ